MSFLASRPRVGSFVLSVYQRPHDERRPLVCLDEASKQLLSDARPVLSMAAGQPVRQNSEYVRNGTASLFVVYLFMVYEPLAGKRHVHTSDRRTCQDFAHVILHLVDVLHPNAEKIILVMDKLNTHTPTSLYRAFLPAEAKRLADKLEVHYTPRHGSWLNMAEIELSVLARQCLSERMNDKENLQRQVAARQQKRNESAVKIDWRFTTDDARIKLKKLHPTILPG